MIHLIKIKKLIIIILLFYSQNLFSQITIHVFSYPQNTPEGDEIYLAGNFNSWNPDDTIYRLVHTEDDMYQITFTPSLEKIEFKFTRGSWASVEGDAQGLEIPNRKVTYDGGPKTLYYCIFGWKDIGPVNSTAVENVSVINENFIIPQLNRTRRIWIYTPPDYNTSNNSYPVMYMQDGQNLFDIITSTSGEWKVDELLNEMFYKGDEKVIVVGIDNGNEKRINEYSPWINNLYGGGEGDEFVRFIVETLKPYIDINFRTKPDRLNTGIMGSSLGALISFYAAIKYQNIFGKAGIFSPSFWFSDEVYTYVESVGKQYDMKIYLLGGEQEGGDLIKNLNDMVTTLRNAGFEDNEIKLVTHADGAHSEWYWSREFPRSYLWLFEDNTLLVPFENIHKDVKIFPNPAKNKIVIEFSSDEYFNVEIFSAKGERIMAVEGSVRAIVPVDKLNCGVYFIRLVSDKSVFNSRITITQ